MVMQIINVPTGFDVGGNDKLIWNASPNGKVFVKSAYNSTFDYSGSPNPLWKLDWKLNCPSKLKTFLWTVAHKKILTNMQRVRRDAFIFPAWPVKVIWNYAEEWTSAQAKANINSMFSYTMYSWCKPLENYFKLNIDGTRSSNSRKIGAGGVLCDHLGSWVDGFQINLGTGEILDAEAWELFFGLKLVFKHSIVNLEIESNSVVLVQLMLKSDNRIHPLGSLLDGCVTMMDNLQNAKLNHIFR
ncbi:hypothetical protein ACLB2K_066628 [Fragaria x ananassa]